MSNCRAGVETNYGAPRMKTPRKCARRVDVVGMGNIHLKSELKGGSYNVWSRAWTVQDVVCM